MRSRFRSTIGRPVTRAVAAVVPVALVVGIGLVAVGTSGSADAAPSDGARLIAQMREAPTATDFAATVEVTWRTIAGARRTATVDVTSVGGEVQIDGGDGRVVLDDHGRTFVKDEFGWSRPLSEPKPQQLPAPDARWNLELRTATALGRPVTVVVATRADGTVAQRLVVDDATHLPLGREVIDRDGRTERSLRFTSLQLNPPMAARAVPSPDATTPRASAVKEVPDGYRAPARLDAGYVLVSRAETSSGIHLVYSDGLFSMSVLEQRGDLDWDSLPAAGTDTTVDGQAARRYVQPLGAVVVWERDGIVFTCVSDAPSDVFATVLAGMDPGASTIDHVADFVLGPFGFD